MLVYAHLSGSFDYNKMLLASMGCAAQIHEKTDKRGTWACHTLDGWYLGTSPEHYRTHRCYVSATQSERLTDMLQLNHKRITRPEVSKADNIMHAISACVKSIKAESNSGSDDQMRQLKQLESLAGRAAAQDAMVQQAIQPTLTHTPPRVLTDKAPSGIEQRLTRSMTAG